MHDASDYLDSKGAHVNFLNGKGYSDEYHMFARNWSGLPMYKDNGVVEQLVASIANTQVTIVISGTGSGKTVIVPKVAAKVMKQLLGGDVRYKLAITNPKSSTTKANAEFAAKCMDVSLGAEVGYHYRDSEPSGKSGQTKLLYLTDGMLLAQTRHDPMLKEYACVIIDEAHERPPPVDFLLQESIEMLRTRPLFRLIVMSATIDAALFTDYFTNRGIGVTTVLAKGAQSHEVTHVYERGTVNKKKTAMNYMKHLSNIVIDNDGGPGGDVLVFVPTSGDAVQGCVAFKGSCISPNCSSVLCTELYSKATDDKKTSSLTPAPDPFIRKVIFATNVAESSFTFEGLGYVIDSGLELSSTWNPVMRCQVIVKRFTTQAQMTQREGRVGRQGPGKVYHLYTEHQRKSEPAFPNPHIVGIDMTSEVVAMFAQKKSLGPVIESCTQLLTPPNVAQITSALALMHFYRMIAVTSKLDATRVVHYNDTDWLSFQELADIPVDLNGILTPFGAIVYSAVSGAMLSPWTAILFVIGAINGQLDVSYNLACILEAVAADPSSMYPLVAPFDAETLIEDQFVVAGKLGCSEHATLLRVFDLAARDDIDDVTFFQKTGMSRHFWSKIVRRSREKRSNKAKNMVQKALADAFDNESIKIWRDAFTALDLKEEAYHADHIAILKVVFLARLYHSVEEIDGVTRVAFHPDPVTIRLAKTLKIRTPIPTASEPTRRIVEFFVDSKNDKKPFAYVTTPFTKAHNSILI